MKKKVIQNIQKFSKTYPEINEEDNFLDNFHWTFSVHWNNNWWNQRIWDIIEYEKKKKKNITYSQLQIVIMFFLSVGRERR